MRSRSHSSIRLAFVTAALLSAAACDPPPLEPDVASAEIAAHTRGVVASASRSLQGRETLARLGRIETIAGVDGLEDVAGLAAQSSAPSLGAQLARMRGAVGPLTRWLQGRELGNAASRFRPDALLAAVTDDDAAELEELIRRRILTKENLESESSDELVYRLRPSPTCLPLGGGAIDDECRQFVERVEIRLRVTRAGAGHAIALWIGRDRIHPLTVAVAPNELAVDVMLAGTKRAIAHLAKTFDEVDESPALMKGTLRVAVRGDGSHKASFALSFLELVELGDPDAAEPFVLRTAPAHPAVAVALDGQAETVDARLAVGMTEALVPWDPREEGRRNTDLRIVLGGLTGKAKLRDGDENLTLTGLGLGAGPSFVEVRGQRVFQLDVNAGDARIFDVAIATFPDGSARFTVSPRFELVVLAKLGLVSADFGGSLPAFLADDTYRLVVERRGGEAPVLEPFVAEHPGDPAGVRVARGEVALSSRSAGRSVTATAGQCLIEKQPAPDEHPVLGSVAVVPCE